MRQAELLDECKEKLNVTSDYALAEELEIPRMRISDYRKGRVKFDEYCYFKIGDLLGISPAIIMAQVQMENEKKPDRLLIYKHFLTTVGLWIILAVIPVSLGHFSNNVYAAGNVSQMASIGHNGSLYEVNGCLFFRSSGITCSGTSTASFDRRGFSPKNWWIAFTQKSQFF
jgi:hypothetical protein